MFIFYVYCILCIVYHFVYDQSTIIINNSYMSGLRSTHYTYNNNHSNEFGRN